MPVLFNPTTNPIIKLCMAAMKQESEGNIEAAKSTFLTAVEHSTNDYERFFTKYHYARLLSDQMEQLKYFKEALDHAMTVDDDNVWRAYQTLYCQIAAIYMAIGDEVNYAKFKTLEHQSKVFPKDRGPFYHGTKADLKVGDFLNPGGQSNYQEDLKMNHIYFTANISGAGLAASLAKGNAMERIYVISPTGDFEDDPNVTDKKFPGNLTRSYRSIYPLKIIGEVTDWITLTETEKQKWLEDIEKGNGEIIN